MNLKAAIAFLLLGLFVVPTFAPSLHALFEEHEHFTCKAVDEKHFHEEHVDCELCDYLINIKPATVGDEEETPGIAMRESLNAAYTAEAIITDDTWIALRGPPATA